MTGANTGIGQAIAVALAQAGARVTAAARCDCDRTLALIPGSKAICLYFADPLAARDIFADADYDILVNVAKSLTQRNASEAIINIA